MGAVGRSKEMFVCTPCNSQYLCHLVRRRLFCCLFPALLASHVDAGAQKTTFFNNTATLCGGDVSLNGRARVSIQSAVLSSSSSDTGGSVCVLGRGALSIMSSVLSGARATSGEGGCLAAADYSLMQVVGTNISDCSSPGCGGGLVALGQARVEVTNSTVTNTTATTKGGSICTMGNGSITLVDSVVAGGTATKETGGCVYGESDSRVTFLGAVVSGCSAPGAGGGINMVGRAVLELVDSSVRNNTAGKVARGVSDISGNSAPFAAGGLHLDDRTSASFRGNKPTSIHNNSAGTVGGGVRLAAVVTKDDLSRYLRVYGNTAPNSPDIGVTATSIVVVSSNGDRLLASDNRDGFLQVALNVSGANGMPSADDLSYTVYDASNNALFTQTVSTPVGDLKELAISLKRPPGMLSELKPALGMCLKNTCAHDLVQLHYTKTRWMSIVDIL